MGADASEDFTLGVVGWGGCFSRVLKTKSVVDICLFLGHKSKLLEL